MSEFLQKLTAVRPSPRQVNWQSLEFYAFIHYGINQFTGREWGDGSESPAIFNPLALDTDQWCRCISRAGMKAVIFTAKHHDGFCLWETKQTQHSVMNSPYGQDMVRQLADSCKKYNLKLGIYLSPWDQHEKTYGSGKAYDDYFCAQLEELLKGYGSLFCLWFDGACGEGQNGKKQVYDWERYYALIRQHQPEAVISVCGPDVRWCGNEAGHCRLSEWSVVPAFMRDNEKIQEASQQEDNGEFRRKVPSDSEDLGSRKALAGIEELIWYPAEVNTSIRPGWFYHEAEDLQVRSLEELTEIYLQAVGGNANFLLNIPPHPQGYITTYDEKRLAELGDWLKESFRENLLAKAVWKFQENDEQPVIEISLKDSIAPKYLLLQEEINQGQRIEEFTLYYYNEEQWLEACRGTVVGYKRICSIKAGACSNKWRLIIHSCRLGVSLQTFEMY